MQCNIPDLKNLLFSLVSDFCSPDSGFWILDAMYSRTKRPALCSASKALQNSCTALLQTFKRKGGGAVI